MEIKDTIESSKEEVIKVEETVEKSFNSINSFIKAKSNGIVYLLLAFIIVFSTFIRIRNLHLLKDVTTGKYIPLALDPFVFLRYGQYILEHGKLMAADMMRFFPLGHDTSSVLSMVPKVNVMIFKFLSLFSDSITFEFVHVIYPVIFFALSMIIFFMLITKIFNSKIALLSTAFLSFIPTFLYRTTAGFSDKESLGIFFMFLAFYFFVSSWQTKNSKYVILFGSLSGLFTGLMGLTWGGVKFIFIIFGVYGLIVWFLSKVNRKDILSYSSWFIVSFFILVAFTTRYGFKSLLTSFTSGIAVLVFVLFIIGTFSKKYLEHLRKKIHWNLPYPIFVFIVISIFGTLFSSLIFGPQAIMEQFVQILQGMLTTMSGNRIAVTVAEQNQPYVTSWFASFGTIFFWMFVMGSVSLFYNMLRPIKEKRVKLTFVYLLFILSFIFSKYSPGSLLNGTSFISKFLYLGSLAFFVLFISFGYLISYYKNKEILQKVKRVNKKYIFIFVWFFLMIVAARSATRLLFVFSPIVSVFAAYFIYDIFRKLKKIKEKSYKILFMIILLLLLVAPINGSLLTFAKTSYSAVPVTGPSYNTQWQHAMSWVNENTSEDSVFAHWWDYGYWVQTGGNRATILDGGNSIGYWNHLMGGHVLTAQNETEALEFLYSHNATHLLVISDEVGKYSAYSSIGSGIDYDKYSWITNFQLSNSQSFVSDNITHNVYLGSYVLDDDFIYEGIVYPRKKAGIVGFVVPIINNENEFGLNRPSAVIAYNGKQISVPMNCAYIDGQFAEFGTSGLPGCFRIIPSISGSQQNRYGAGLYLSERGVSALWTQLFLFNKESSYFNLVYDDSNNFPLALYNGRLIGPLKIWKLNYPSTIEFIEEYLSINYPEELMEVKSEYY